MFNYMRKRLFPLQVDYDAVPTLKLLRYTMNPTLSRRKS